MHEPKKSAAASPPSPLPPVTGSKFRGLVRRKPVWLGAGIVLAAALTWTIWSYMSDPPKPWVVRRQIASYLKKETSTSDFKSDFPFPSKAAMAKAPGKGSGDANDPRKGSRTGMDFDTLKDEYIRLKAEALRIERDASRAVEEIKETKDELEELNRRIAAAADSDVAALQLKAKVLRERAEALEQDSSGGGELKAIETAMAPIVSDLWAFQRAWQNGAGPGESATPGELARAADELSASIRNKLRDAGTYGAMYRLVGQELWVAARLLGSADPEHRKVGVNLALQASRHAVEDAQNGWLAARICEGYVLPQLALANDKDRRSTFNLERFLYECANIFRRSGETKNVIRTYEVVVARTANAQTADWARVQIASIHEQAGELKLALQYLKQVKLTNDFSRDLRRISRLEQQIKAQ